MNFDHERYDRLGDLDLGGEKPSEFLTESERAELIEQLTAEKEVEFHEAKSPLDTERSSEHDSNEELEDIIE